MSVMVCPPAWTSSAGRLSNHADFPFLQCFECFHHHFSKNRVMYLLVVKYWCQRLHQLSCLIENLSRAMRKCVVCHICEQQRRKSACAFAQSDQRLCFSLLR